MYILCMFISFDFDKGPSFIFLSFGASKYFIKEQIILIVAFCTAMKVYFAGFRLKMIVLQQCGH
jgi:hypothetical protein